MTPLEMVQKAFREDGRITVICGGGHDVPDYAAVLAMAVGLGWTVDRENGCLVIGREDGTEVGTVVEDAPRTHAGAPPRAWHGHRLELEGARDADVTRILAWFREHFPEAFGG